MAKVEMKMMTFDDVCALLETDDSFEWMLTGDRQKLRGVLRNTLASMQTDFCPITAACHIKTKAVYPTDQAREAAELIGLPIRFRGALFTGGRIMRLADNFGHARYKQKTSWDKLKAACGNPQPVVGVVV